jgi:hypothetical protein
MLIHYNIITGAEGGTRTPMGCPTRPSNVRVYQFHHFGTCEILPLQDYLEHIETNYSGSLY